MSKAMEKRHAQTLRKIASEEAAEAEKMKCGGGVKKRYARGGGIDEVDRQITFGDAFKAARAHGKDKFTYKGKEYSTKYSEEVPQKSIGARGSAKTPRMDLGPMEEPKTYVSAANRPTPPRPVKDKVEPSESEMTDTFKRGGGVKKYARGGGIEATGKTKGRFI